MDAITTLKKENGTQTTSVKETLKRAEEHFGSLFEYKKSESRQRDGLKEKKTKENKLPKKHQKKLVATFKTSDIKKAIKNLKNGKATGPDGIPNEFLKTGGDSMETEIRDLCNEILRSRITPSSWREGRVIVLYKGKGDRTDMNNYRGITLNNTISKLFSGMMCERLVSLTEREGWLGQIQNGFRKNRQAMDSIFVLRTIMEKSARMGNSEDRDLSLMFVDLQKAYDTVPRDLLWKKLNNLGLGNPFVDILKSLYNQSFLVVSLNGMNTEKIYPQRGLKQGCPLSPLLFSLYISGLGKTIEQSTEGVPIFGKIISGLLFADDLVIISKSRDGAERLQSICQKIFEEHGLKINCAKSNILQMKEEDYPEMKLWSTNGEDLGCIEKAIRYKYLGIPLKLKEKCNIFDFKRTEIIARAKSYAAKVISMARESFDPCHVADALWKQVAMEGILYGIKVASVTKEILRKLDSIQAHVGAFILGVRQTCSHDALL